MKYLSNFMYSPKKCGETGKRPKTFPLGCGLGMRLQHISAPLQQEPVNHTVSKCH